MLCPFRWIECEKKIAFLLVHRNNREKPVLKRNASTWTVLVDVMQRKGSSVVVAEVSEF